MDLQTGKLITAPQANNVVFFREVHNPLYLKVIEHISRPFNNNYDGINIEIRFNHNLWKSLKLHKCWLFFLIWTTLEPLSSNFLHLFKFHVMWFLKTFGVISINSVIRAVQHFVGPVDRIPFL